MSDYEIIDTVDGYQILPGDLVAYEGEVYAVLGIADDETDIIGLSVECLTDTDGDDYLPVDPWETLSLVTYTSGGE